MYYTLSTLLEILLTEQASGLHLHPGEKPVVEVVRTLFHVSGPAIESNEIEQLLRHIATRDEYREFDSAGIVSCYYHVPGRAWFTVMAFREQGHTRLEFRAVR